LEIGALESFDNDISPIAGRLLNDFIYFAIIMDVPKNLSHERRPERFIRPFDIPTNAWRIFDRRVRVIWRRIWGDGVAVAFLYYFSTLLFVAMHVFSHNPFLGTLRLIPGFLSLLFVPGILISNLLLPSERRVVWVAVLVGLVFQAFVIQLLFLLMLVDILAMPLLTWVLFTNIPLVTMLCIETKIRNREISISLSTISDSRLIQLVIIALLVRLALWAINPGSIAPDASLYADYSRSIINGEFQSNVLTDGRLYGLWNGMQYCFHQGYTYLLSISWLMAEPTVGGPTFILVLIGTTLVLVVYDITKRFFGRNAALLSATILTIHPLFVFHSAVAYGPEISSLLFALGGMNLIAKDGESRFSTLIAAGIFIGLSDIIWTPNFLLFGAALPAFFVINHPFKKVNDILASVGIVLVTTGRVFFLNQSIFLFSWLAAMLTIGLASFASLRSKWRSERVLAHFLALAGTIAFWRTPVQIIHSENSIISVGNQANNLLVMLQLPNPPISAFLRPISLETVIGFLFFLLFHVTPLVFFFILLTITLKPSRRRMAGILAMAAIAGIGTLFVINMLADYKDTLTLSYLYSDSRFFLSLVSFLVIACSAFLVCKGVNGESQDWPKRVRYTICSRRKTQIAVGVILMINFVPGYYWIPQGFELVNYEERYGWKNLDRVIQTLPGDSIFIVDRTTEFSWLTGQRTVDFNLWGPGISLHRAVDYVERRAALFNATYFIIDRFTIARWNTFHQLYYPPYLEGDVLPIDIGKLFSSKGSGAAINVSSVKMIGQSESTRANEYARVLGFSDADYSKEFDIDFLEPGWSASNQGALVNQSGSAKLIIGTSQNYTNTWRPGSFDLGASLSSGCLLINFSEMTAEIARIALFNDSGNLLSYASLFSEGHFYAFFGIESLGDIRIVIEGDPGSSVTINAATYWSTPG
jgi:hypothetical protein